MFLRICVLLLGVIHTAHANLSLSPAVSVVSIPSGSSFEINCTSSSSVMWSAVSGNLPSTASGSVRNPNDNVSTLTFKNVTEGGTYRCASSGVNIDFTLKVLKVSTKEPTFIYLQDTVLGCKVTDESHNYTYSWRKGNITVEDLKKKTEDSWEYKILENGSLALKHPQRTLAGEWTCVATYTDASGLNTVNITVNYWAEPYVKPFDKSQNLVQDEKLTIECQVLGHPKPNITWTKGETVIVPTERLRLEASNSYNGETIDNAKLIIQTVDFDDGGEYFCTASTPSNPSDFKTLNDTEKVLVRVKDKLAALWPFLGIVAEVVILCTIIFIYEKKRNKDAAAEENPAQDGTTPEKKSEGVRHRGSNNPRA